MRAASRHPATFPGSARPHDTERFCALRLSGVGVLYPSEPMPTAAVCRRGHVASSYVGSSPLPIRCEECGAAVLRECPACGVALRGDD